MANTKGGCDELSAAAVALLDAIHGRTEVPPDSFTQAMAAKKWGLSPAATKNRILRARQAGRLAATMVGRIAYYHAPVDG